MRQLDPDDVERRLRAAIDDGDTAKIDRLGAWLDRHEPVRDAPQMLASALWYATKGLRVFPLQRGSKIPYARSRGCHDATCDAEQIRQWWVEHPESNLAIATGGPVDVIDIDGIGGNLSWARNMYDEHDAYQGPSVLGMCSTPRPGGRHLYIVSESGRGNRAGLLPGVDYRGAGGYVVCPPSRTDVGIYLWRKPLDLATMESAA